MAFRIFKPKKYHTKLENAALDQLFSFKYEVGFNDQGLSNIFLKNNNQNSLLALHFGKGGNKLFCQDIAGNNWRLFNNYNIPITEGEAQTLLATGELSQTIDTEEADVLLSNLVLKTFPIFYGSLQTVSGSGYCSGIIYDPSITQKVYFLYIKITGNNTANWKLIPIT